MLGGWALIGTCSQSEESTAAVPVMIVRVEQSLSVWLQCCPVEI